jgi:hypothetical protein
MNWDLWYFPGVGEEDEMKEQAAVAVEESLRHSAVGVVSGSGKQKWKGLGAGALVRWKSRELVLTAEHVIGDTAKDDLRFFLPLEDVPKNANRETLTALRGVPTARLFPFVELDIHSVAVDKALDLAAIDITGCLSSHKIAKFLDVEAGGSTPQEGTAVISRGYPHDLTKVTFDNEQVAFMFVHWADVEAPRDGLQSFDAKIHFLTGFDGEGNAHPAGMSGSAGCVQRKRGDQVWVADLDVGGVTIGYYEKSRLLKLVRREAVEQFLTSHF